MIFFESKGKYIFQNLFKKHIASKNKKALIYKLLLPLFAQKSL